MSLRESVRALILDPADRVLLVRFPWEGPDLPDGFWANPGGGIEAGETRLDALRRELREEVGLEIHGMGPEVWTKTAYFPLGRWDGQVDHIHLVRTPFFDPSPGLSDSELAAEHVHEIRWWSHDELHAPAPPSRRGTSPRSSVGCAPRGSRRSRSRSPVSDRRDPYPGRMRILLALRFLAELGMLACLGVGGWRLGDSLLTSVLLAVLLPGAAAAAWGLWVAPRATHRLGDPARLAVEVTLFAAAFVLAMGSGLTPVMPIVGFAVWAAFLASVPARGHEPVLEDRTAA